MNKIDDFLACAYDASVDQAFGTFNPEWLPREFRTFIVDYVTTEEKTIGESLSEYLGLKL